MEKEKVDFKKISSNPGIYIFKYGKKYLYVGKATDLRSRIRSYFSSSNDRGPQIKEMVREAKKIETIETDNVLDAIIVEAYFIKKYKPIYNIKEKDNKSFNYLIITDEEFPRVLVKRGRELEKLNVDTLAIFGPFASSLKEALKIVRKSIPFRDRCNIGMKRPCFNAQIGLCPGVCFDKDRKKYMKNIKSLIMLFEGKRKKIISNLEKDMKKLAKNQDFEKAEKIKKQIFNLENIQDVSLIKKDHSEGSMSGFRIEGYDVAHLSGANAVGVMVVSIDGEFDKNEYRVFNIKQDNKRSDVDSLREILKRRRNRTEWDSPRLIVVDGNKIQLNVANEVFPSIPKVSVVKDSKHKPKGILGDKIYSKSREREILEINAESHRFALSQHRKRRDKVR